jgi:lipopolysaccharide transport system permease protein
MRVIRARYQQSILGGLWAIAQPVATVAIFTAVFSFILKVDTQGVPYPVFSYTAMVPWLLFSTSITDMAESIVGNMNLVAKIYFPRDILVIAAMLARVLDFLIASLVLVVLMVAFSLPVFQVQWLFLRYLAGHLLWPWHRSDAGSFEPFYRDLAIWSALLQLCCMPRRLSTRHLVPEPLLP